jgi:hypothetical protein
MPSQVGQTSRRRVRENKRLGEINGCGLATLTLAGLEVVEAGP